MWHKLYWTNCLFPRNWLTKARNLCSNEFAKEFHLDTLADEIDIVEKDLSQNPQDVVFCHNDLQYGNIMIDEKTRSITIIVSTILSLVIVYVI